MPPPNSEHMVRITKVDANSKVGLGLSAVDGRSLRILKVDSEGLIPSWNRENPDQQVRSGDRIVEVNGVCGDARAMIETCKNNETLQIKVRYTADIEHRHRMLQYRNLLPEDFELLRLLDETVPPAKKTCLRQSFVAQLPRRKASSCGTDKCAICLIDCGEDAEMTQLPCRHYFCTECIEHWLTQCRDHCPICMAPVECPEEDEGSTCDGSVGSDVGRESESDDCSALVHASILMPKIVSATRCEGLGSRAARPRCATA